ncbi:hypothetical protein Q7C36_001545 [Tachysurus vachellii]|uniref:Interferon-induced protein 44-like n=1 Tax=Tachysurus vachellii TaxID=175792 RepID=A0AA88TBF6_TACVA|nr:hypothetical protein Q7C36_001545 [Tachysurus vachellii]
MSSGMRESVSASMLFFPDFEQPWRNTDWKQFRILLHGAVGAGKSCFVNSVRSVYKERIVFGAAEGTSAGKSCTKNSKSCFLFSLHSWNNDQNKKINHILLNFSFLFFPQYKTYKITDKDSVTLPFVLTDVMGLEHQDEDGIHPDDIINVLHGRVKEGYTFNPASSLTDADPDYIHEPSLNDKVHCLVSNRIFIMENEMIQKMKAVRKSALKLGLPHVVLMTNIGADVCPLVTKDLADVYKSRKIKEKMQECSHTIGPALKCIFPVSNYYEETETDDKKHVLILWALKAIAGFVKDYFEDLNI